MKETDVKKAIYIRSLTTWRMTNLGAVKVELEDQQIINLSGTIFKLCKDNGVDVDLRLVGIEEQTPQPKPTPQKKKKVEDDDIEFPDEEEESQTD